MDGQTREGEAFGLKPNQPVRHGWASRRPKERERRSQLVSKWGQPAREGFRSWLHRLVRLHHWSTFSSTVNVLIGESLIAHIVMPRGYDRRLSPDRWPPCQPLALAPRRQRLRRIRRPAGAKLALRKALQAMPMDQHAPHSKSWRHRRRRQSDLLLAPSARSHAARLRRLAPKLGTAIQPRRERRAHVTARRANWRTQHSPAPWRRMWKWVAQFARYGLTRIRSATALGARMRCK